MNHILKKAISGSYYPSSFIIEVDTYDTGEDIILNNSEVIYHELTHFIHDISTCFGLLNFSNFCQEITDSVAYIYNQGKSEEITLPIRNISNTRRLNRDLYSLYNGDSDKIDIIQSLENINFTKNDLIENFENLPIIELIYIDNSGKKNNRNFGAIALFESAANLLESHIFGKNNSPDYPYNSSRHISDFILPYKISDELLFLIIEFSLFSTHPAELFVELLNEIRDNSNIDKFELLEYLKNYKFQSGFFSCSKSYTDVLDKCRQRANENLKNFFGNNEFIEIFKFMTKRIDYIVEKRIRDPFFISNIFTMSSKKAYKYMDLLFSQIGAPIITNLNGDFIMLSEEVISDDVLLFGGIKSIFSSLCEGKHSCYLKTICNNKNSKLNTDHNCITSPWKRSKYEYLCYYAKLWKVYSLSNWKFN